METKHLQFRLPESTVLDEFSTWPNQTSSKEVKIFQASFETSSILALRQKVNPEQMEIQVLSYIRRES